MRVLSHRPQTPDFGYLPTEKDAAKARIEWRIANATTLRDGGEMFLDLPECER